MKKISRYHNNNIYAFAKTKQVPVSSEVEGDFIVLGWGANELMYK